MSSVISPCALCEDRLVIETPITDNVGLCNYQTLPAIK
jgi:hypothetical protein